jgi:DNA (cytosine-5)-methyltransferase 1
LKSPVKQRGRDFAIILASLSDLGYAVEWRVINAAEYGFPQRRRRTFILGYHNSTDIHGEIHDMQKTDWIFDSGILARAFPVLRNQSIYEPFLIDGDLVQISNEFNCKGGDSPFENAGIMVNRIVTSLKTKPVYDGMPATLGNVLQSENEVKSSFYLNGSFERWKYLKGPKSESRTNKESGFEYQYNEGGMIFPDPLDQPSRTIITGEGGPSPSRFKHVVCTESGKLRRLTPLDPIAANTGPRA